MTKLIRRYLVTVTAMLMASQAIVASQSEWSTETLMLILAEVKEAELTFVERRSSSFLIDEIKLTGTMRYLAPDLIEKSVQTPFVENIKIDGDSLSIEKVTDHGESRVKSYSLTSHEALNTTVEGIRATLSGNLTVLAENYDIELTGSMQEWSVLLVPKKEEVLGYIEKIAVSGSKDKIKVIETFDADGDESRLDLSYQTMK